MHFQTSKKLSNKFTNARASKRTACDALFLFTFLTTSVPIKIRCKTYNHRSPKIRLVSIDQLSENNFNIFHEQKSDLKQ